jgi:hypothetical protein
VESRAAAAAAAAAAAKQALPKKERKDKKKKKEREEKGLQQCNNRPGESEKDRTKHETKGNQNGFSFLSEDLPGWAFRRAERLPPWLKAFRLARKPSHQDLFQAF